MKNINNTYDNGTYDTVPSIPIKRFEDAESPLAANLDEHPKLYGYSRNNEDGKELNSLDEVANFIYTEGLLGDVLITTADGEPFISTMGFFIDRIADADYRQKLLEVLVPLQMGL